MKTEYKLTMKELPKSERPYEKLEKFGAEYLSDSELLAIIIKTGNRNETSVAVAQRILSRGNDKEGLSFLHHISLDELKKIKGIGRVKAIQLKALMELAKRISSTLRLYHTVTITSPNDVAMLLMEEIRHLNKEVFKVILVNTKNHVIRCIDVSMGSLNATIVHPREVFTEAVKVGCYAVILVHNHPSGDPMPGIEDIETTKRIVKAGEILGIKVLDHIIIGEGKYTSLKEKGLL